MIMFLKPAAGLKVYDPEAHAHLPVEGRRVAATAYWLRRLRDGDVIEVPTTNELPED